jgi:prefoldin subunit 5
VSPQSDIEMAKDVAVLKEQIKHLTDMMHELKRATEKQDHVLDSLIEMANKGKGSLWMLLAIGGFIGAVVSNISTIVTFFKH